MLAFEIKINDSAPMVVAADNHVIADFTYGVLAINPNSVLIAGFDDFNRYICLKFTDVDKPSHRTERQEPPCQESIAHQSSDDTREWEFKLERYHRLKAYLENEHLILWIR